MSEKEKKEKKKERSFTIETDEDKIPVEEISELLGVVNKEIPGLIKGLFSALYSAETAEQYANGIGTIYKTLTEQGLPEDMVRDMVSKYADSINIIGKSLQNIEVGSKSKKYSDD